jgi:hypothetical protein
VTFGGETSRGWQTVSFAKPINLVAGRDYVASYHTTTGYYAAQQWAFAGGATLGNRAIQATAGLYEYGTGGFPRNSWHDSAYYMDVLFRPMTSGKYRPPSSSQPNTSNDSATPTNTTTPPSRVPTGAPTSAASPPAPAPTPSPTSASQRPTSTASASASPVAGTLPGWPSASNTGFNDPSPRRLDGDQLVDAAWLQSNGSGGAGTATSPYKIDGLLVAGMLHINVGGNVYVTVTNSRIYGGDFAGLWLESGHVTVTDTTIAPASGGRSTIGVLAYSNGTFLRDDIYGYNVGIMMQGNGPYLVQDNYFHDTYYVPGDHTDVLNMNPHASNGVIKHNWIDGGRMDGQYTHNGIGLYNDATPGQGTAPSANWTVDNNYITRSNYLIYAAATPPFVIKNNVLTTKFLYGVFFDALPGATDGGGNVDENGKTVRILG